MEQIFVSSVQKELRAERQAVREFVHGNDLLRQFFRVFLFEDLPPADRKTDDVYLEQVKDSPIYLGMFGNEYGRADKDGLSATEKEFAFATRLRKRRLILVKGRDDKGREPKMAALIRRAGDELVRRRFENTDELLRLLYGSLIQYLQDRGFVAARDFDAAACEDATLKDISARKVRWFIEKARAERGYALAPDTPPKQALAHLNLLARNDPTRGAVLLFSDAPERFMHSAEVTCLHFHGTEIVKPIPSQQVYRGSLFEVVDRAVDFAMDRLRRAVVPSESSPASEVRYEVPFRVVREAIVNAVAHRNYASKSGVQVMVFADRIEVWNPGGLPEDLTLDMIRLCAEAGLPEPEFRSEGERFVTVIWRDWLTEKVLADLNLNARQQEAVAYVKRRGRIANSEYQQLTGATRKTAARDLDELITKGVFKRAGEKRGSHYLLTGQK